MGGEEYKAHHKQLNPFFYPTALQQYIPIINTKMQNFMKRFDNQLGSNEVDFVSFASDFTFETILATMFGIDQSGRLKFLHDWDM